MRYTEIVNFIVRKVVKVRKNVAAIPEEVNEISQPEYTTLSSRAFSFPLLTYFIYNKMFLGERNFSWLDT